MQHIKRVWLKNSLGLLGILLGALISTVHAQEFNSSSYKVLDPVVAPGGFGSSASYQLWGVFSQLSIGTSTATGFRVNSGFLYFPFVSTPVVTATAGDSQVALSWATVTGSLGWTVSGYNVGQSTTSGGSYTYSSLGNVTSSTRTGLTNSTTYYFVIRVEDALGNTIATSTEVSATPVASSGAGAGSGSSSSGGGTSRGVSRAELSGLAYPDRPVVVLRDGVRVAEVRADSIGQFRATVNNVPVGTNIFAVYAIDQNNLQSKLLTFPLAISAGLTAQIAGIFIPPTLSTNKNEVASGDPIKLFGQSTPNALVEIEVKRGETNLIVRALARADGNYSHDLSTTNLTLGNYEAKARSVIIGPPASASQFGLISSWILGTKNILREKLARCPRTADLNNDCLVNLFDFSILAYWLDRPNPPPAVDLEKNKIVDLKDFSIAAYYWTG